MKFLCLLGALFFLGCAHKKSDQEKAKDWFNKGAYNCDKENLHHCSEWRYLSKEAFDVLIMDGASKLGIKDSDKIFDMGVGVGAALLVMDKHYKNLELGGSDFAENAIKKAKEVFPRHAKNFYLQDMSKKHEKIPANYYDHVVSFGALAMYLTLEQMNAAIKEAVRMTKPGGTMLFTSFIAPGGKNVGSIITPVDPRYWQKKADYLGIKDVEILPMKHQGDRYMLLCKK
jgi:cyclopropane fatty-acyl-phospholipid synthase-like methyltransferase